MSLEQQEKTIDGTTYHINQMPARESVALLTEILKIIGPATMSTVGDGKSMSDVLDADLKDEGVQNIAETLFTNLDSNRVIKIIDNLSKHTFIDGTRLNNNTFDVHFQGKLMTMFKWLVFALQVQYSDFFDGTTAGVGAVRELLQ